MNLYQARKILRKSFLKPFILLIFITLSSVSFAGIFDEGDAANGKKVFNTNCASCHNVTSVPKTGPGLAGLADRWGSTEEMLVKWITNPTAALATGDAYIQSVVDVWRPEAGLMSAQLVDEGQIKDIMAYIANPNVGGDGPAVATNECVTIHEEMAATGDSGRLMILIFIVLFLIILVSLSSVSRTLQNVSNLSDGGEVKEEESYFASIKAWMWKRRVAMGITSFVVVCALITIGYIDLMGIGVYEDYEPTQPIAFSHAIHNCENDIDCEYCHFTARKSKHAGIPHAMLCMNCHKEIKEGAITGTQEIQKIYDAVGYDPEGAGGAGAYIENYEEKPIVWNKVHNLPDHVFFPHNQHVEVANIDCKQCHGPVDKYTVGRIASTELTNSQEIPGLIKLSKPTLTMGWCIECHRESKIDMSNGYYEEMHTRMVEEGNERGNEEWGLINEDNKITVKEMGGWECAKCHY